MPGRHFSFQRYLQQHLPHYVFVSILFVMGVMFGTYMVNALSLELQMSMAQDLIGFFRTVAQEFEGSAPQPQSFAAIFGSHVKWVLLILVFGLSIIGAPLILFLVFIKGMLVGFSIGYLVGQFSWKGLFFAVISIAPHNLIVIPVMLVSSVAAVSFSWYLTRSLVMRKHAVEARPFKSYLATHLSLCLLVLCASLIQYAFVPHLIEWAAPIMLETG
jgi:stage II sporulation protein M